MTKERTSNERFEIVGLTKAEVDRCMEVLCGGPVPWDRGYCVASSELFARPVASEEQRLKSALITVWENLSTIRPNDFKQPDGEAETQVNRAYCAAENALLEVGRLRRAGHSVELVPTKGESQ